MNNFKLLVKYFDVRWTGDILPQSLIGRPKSLQAALKWLMSFCSSSSECVIIATSSVTSKGRSHNTHASLHFVCRRYQKWSHHKPQCLISRSFGGQPVFGGILEEPISAYRVKGLDEVTKWDVQWLSLFSTFFLVVIWWRISYQLWIFWHGKQMWPWINFALQTLGKSSRRRDQRVFLVMLRSEMPR